MNFTIRRIRSFPGLSLISLIVILTCSASSRAEPANRREKPGKTVAVFHCEYAPVSYWDKNANKPSGFFVDIMDSVAVRAGLDVEYICRNGWPEMIKALEDGEADLAVLMRSAEREKTMLFSAPIEETYLSFFARSQSSINPDKKPAGQTIGVVAGSMSYEQLKNRPGVRLQTEGTYQEGLFRLLAGEIGLFAGEESMILKTAREAGLDDRIKKTGKPFVERERCLVVRRNDIQLLDRLNKALRGFVGSPEYQRIYLTWYGTPAPYWTSNRMLVAGGVFLVLAVGGMASWRYRSLLRMNKKLTRNIAERRQAEEALQESEARFRVLFEQAAAGVALVEVPSGRFLHINRKYCDIIGYNQDEMTEKSFWDITHPDDLQTDVNNMKALDAGAINGIAREKRYVRKDGNVVWVKLSVSPMTRQGVLLNYHITVVEDITERRHMQEQLEQKAAEQNAILENALVGIAHLNDRQIIWTNGKIEQMFGYERGEIIGRSTETLYPSQESAVQLGREAYRLLASGETFHSERLMKRKDGTCFWCSLSGKAVDPVLPGKGSIWIFQDISVHKSAEEEIKRVNQNLEDLVSVRTRELKQTNERLTAEVSEREHVEEELIKAQKLESLAVLAGGIAHDFNNMLTTVLGNLSLAMLDVDQGGPVYRRLETVETAALRAQDLTQQLLTFAKGGAPVKQTVDVGEIVRESVAFALRGSRVNYNVSLQDGLWPVEADEGQLAQVMHNLVINADHAMPQGGSITVRCGNCVLSEGEASNLPGGRYVRTIVQDTGIGILKDHLQRIFDPYFTTKQKGSGLGLSVVYSIVHKHDGHISVESTPGKRTAFTILLPASDALEAPQKSVELAIPSGSGKILLMDDEADVRQTAGDVLHRLGYVVVFADTGERAIDHYREALEANDPFSVVILDLTIPGGMGGAETLRMLRQIDPDVKAIVSSGYSIDPVMAEYRSYGFSGVVAKPYRIKELGDVVNRIINMDVRP